MSRAPFNCLIRTHHITSRKKARRVRHAADQLGLVSLLLRSGGSPGIMFAESDAESNLVDWVAEVQALRYKDFRCVARPAPAEVDAVSRTGQRATTSRRTVPTPANVPRNMTFYETESVADFAQQMEAKGLINWWKKAMGYTK